jgi:hypothetical protein
MTRPKKGARGRVTAVVAGDRSFLVKGTGPFARAKARRIAREPRAAGCHVARPARRPRLTS